MCKRSCFRSIIPYGILDNIINCMKYSPHSYPRDVDTYYLLCHSSNRAILWVKIYDMKWRCGLRKTGWMAMNWWNCTWPLKGRSSYGRASWCFQSDHFCRPSQRIRVRIVLGRHAGERLPFWEMKLHCLASGHSRNRASENHPLHLIIRPPIR